MKIGIDNYSYHRYFGEVYEGQRDPGVIWDLSDFFSHVSENLQEAEAVSLESCFITVEEKNEIVNIIKDTGSDIVFSWGHPNGFMDVSTDQAVNEIIQYIKMTKAVGQSVLRIAASSIMYFSEPHIEQVKRAVSIINLVKDAAKDHEVKLALENHGDFYAEEIMEILTNVDSDYVGVTFDTGNSLRLKEDCVNAIRKYGEKIFLVHAKDVAYESGLKTGPLENLNCVPAGEGIVNFKNIFIELGRIRYEGMVLIEISRLHSYYTDLEETMVINRSLKYLKELRSEIYA